MKKLGLIAGNRSFPIYVARAAKAQGYEVVAVGLKEETDAQLEKEVDKMLWLSLSQAGQVPDLLKQSDVQEVILAGQIRAERLLSGEDRFDGVVQQLFKLVPDRSGSSAMKLAVSFLEGKGFRVLDSGSFLKEWIPGAGVLTKRPPSLEEQEDVSAGLHLARQMSRLKIGQTVILKKKAVVAVEAIEGTDAAIERAGKLIGPGCVVVKACGPEHDMRFDIPVVGLETIRAMHAAGVGCLGVEAKRTLFFDRPQLIAEADKLNIAVVAVS